MEIDLFMEFATPGHAGVTEPRAVTDGLALARAADAAGFGAVWVAEHHFLDEYSMASAPDMLLAAMARETHRIGLGLGVIPLTLHDPLRVAERLATLDLLSDGRVLWGVGRGVTLTELAGFGVAPEESRAIFLDRLAVLREMLGTGMALRGGEKLSVRPAPGARLNNPWMAAVSPESFDLAAELGLNVLTGPFKPRAMVLADLARYRHANPTGRTSFTMAVYCETDHRAARRRAEAGIVWTFRKIFEVSRPLLAKQIAGYEHYRALGRLRPLIDAVLGLRTLETMGLAAVGNPDHISRQLRRLRRAGLDRVSLVIGGGDLNGAEQRACLDLIAERVMPELAAAKPAHPVVVPA